jgi:hypothetical protein
MNIAATNFWKAVSVSSVCLLAISQGAWDLYCEQCGDRVDFVTRGVGDAVEVNKAAQRFDPWPAHAYNRNLSFNGKRGGLAMQRYEMNRSLQPRPLNATKPAEQPPVDNSFQAPVPQQ